MAMKSWRMTGTLLCAFTIVALFALMPRARAAETFDALLIGIEAANSNAGGSITLDADITLSAALPPLTGDISIDGGGHTISGDEQYRIFDVNGGKLTIKNLTLTGGNAEIGGAIRLRNGAEVSIESSTLSDNKATHGGAIAASSSSAKLSVKDSSFRGNIAEKSGGAIYAKGGTVSVLNSVFEKNCALFAFYALIEGVNSEQHSVDAEGCHRVRYVRSEIDAELQSHVDGGAIRLLNGALATVERSTFSENKATYGGAISTPSNNVRLSVNNSSFVENRASQSGGAISGGNWLGGGRIAISSSSFVKNSVMDGDGGAIEASRGALDITNSTFSENHSDGGGGAVKIDENAEVTITHATFIENWSRHGADVIRKTGGKAYLRNSIVASEADGEDCVGAWEHVGNLSTDGTCADRPSDDPRLGDLTGSPAYYPPRDRSPAVDYADPKFCLETDQLGTPRPQGGGCDIGAIEARGAIAAEPTPVPPLVCTLAHQIVAANRDWPSGGCPAGSGVDTISLDKDITLFEPLPAIASSIIIEGNGHTISGEGKFRIFDVDGGILTVKNLTMREGNGRNENGGAIRLQNNGRATVSDSRFINNAASTGGAIFIGWVGVDNSWATVTNSSFVENHASNSGGAIYAGGGIVSVNNSSFVENYSGGAGAGSAIGMVNHSTRLDVVNSSFINKYSPALSIENGVIATLTHVTIYGPYDYIPALHTREDSFTSAGKFNLRNSIVVGNVSSAVCENLKQNISNLIKDGSCSPMLSGDPMLEKATDSSAYLELLPGSPAINAADARFCPDTDQLGRARSFVGRCDIGAIEAIPVSQALSDCTVTTTHLLNFRDGPSGKIIGGVPQNATLSVLARTPRWFEVEHEGASGWISADYVVAQGDCG